MEHDDLRVVTTIPAFPRRDPAVAMSRLAIAIALLLAVLSPASPSVAVLVSTGSVVWEGTVDLPDGAIVPKGSSLRIEPGTAIALGEGGTIRVEGRLAVAGTAESPVTILSGQPVQGGEKGQLAAMISLGSSTDRENRIEHLVARGSGDGIVVNGSYLFVAHVSVSAVGDALRIENDSRADGKDLELSGVNRDLAVLLRSAASFEQVRSRGKGIEVQTGGALGIKGGTVEGAEAGIWMRQMERGFLEDVRFEQCRLGLFAHSVGPEVRFSRLRFTGCEEGMVLGAFCAPVVEGCVFEGGRKGLTVATYSTPVIANCTFRGLERGLFLNLKANPSVTGCCFAGNDVAVAVDFSSYPRINFNSFTGNRIALQMGDTQSADWEKRVGSWGLTKGQAIETGSRRITGRTGAGRPNATEPLPQNNFLDGWVDARWNWWGEEDARVIQRKGPRADLPMIDDSWGRATVTYEGYPGRYALDRFEYWPSLDEPWDALSPCKGSDD